MQGAGAKTKFTPRQMYDVHGGGGLYTRSISQWIGALIASWSANRGFHPSILTLTNLVIGLLSSVASTFAGTNSLPLLGLVALIGWQVAYAFDCADGQVARAAGRGSHLGARLDVLCDFAIHSSIAIAVASIIIEQSGSGGALVGAYASLITTGLVLNVVGKQYTGVHILSQRSIVADAARLLIDYGFMVLVLALTVTIRPNVLLWVASAYIILNGAHLVGSIILTSRSSLSRQTSNESTQE